MKEEKKILVVDDQKALTLSLSGFFSYMGYKMLNAFDGKQALEIIEAERPDVVLLDMQIPGIHGIGVLKDVRKRYPEMKVLIITAYDEETKEIVENIGIDGFFPKPIVLTELTRRIEEVLATKESTLVYPTKVAPPEVEGLIPKAKILSVGLEALDPAELEIAIEDSEAMDSKYDFEYAYSRDETLDKLKRFKPDIVILPTELSKRDYGDGASPTASLANKIMNSQYRPKELILYGIFASSTDAQAKEAIEGLGGRTWTQNFENDLSRKKLSKMIREACFKHGLVERKSEIR